MVAHSFKLHFQAVTRLSIEQAAPTSPSEFPWLDLYLPTPLRVARHLPPEAGGTIARPG